MSFVRKLAISREIIFQMLNERDVDTEVYNNFSVEELNVLYKNSTKSTKELNPIDMEFSGDKKVYVKYLFNSRPRVANIITLVESMEEDVLEEGDTLILILKDQISNDSSLEVYFEELYQKKKIFVQYFWIDLLMFNVLNHVKVPKHEILSVDEREEFIKSLDIKSETQLPQISKVDPVAKFLGMKTNDICRIIRTSETAGKTLYYRLCK